MHAEHACVDATRACDVGYVNVECAELVHAGTVAEGAVWGQWGGVRVVLALEVEEALLGPAPGYPARVRGRYRWHVVLRMLPSPATDMPSLLGSLPIPPTWTVDVDPVTLA